MLLPDPAGFGPRLRSDLSQLVSFCSELVACVSLLSVTPSDAHSVPSPQSGTVSHLSVVKDFKPGLLCFRLETPTPSALGSFEKDVAGRGSATLLLL